MATSSSSMLSGVYGIFFLIISIGVVALCVRVNRRWLWILAILAVCIMILVLPSYTFLITLFILLISMLLTKGGRKTKRGKEKVTTQTFPSQESQMNPQMQPEGPNTSASLEISDEQRFARLYARQEKIPADAVERSAYIAWLVKEGHYEEAERVSSM